MNQVIDRLHIGDWQDAKKSTGFYIITVAGDSPFIGDEHFSLVDGPGNPPQVFADAVEAVVRAHRRQPKPVLVHCIAGRSRSASVVIAAVKKLTGRDICEAIDLVFVKHDRTRIHPHMARLLLDL